MHGGDKNEKSWTSITDKTVRNGRLIMISSFLHKKVTVRIYRTANEDEEGLKM